MNNGLTKKMEELLWRARQSHSFEIDLQSFKDKYKVPSVADIGEDDLWKWLTEKYGESIEGFFARNPKTKKDIKDGQYILDRMSFLKKYNLPTSMEGELMDFLIIGRTPPYINFDIEPPYDDEETVYGRRILRLAIYEGATQKETLAFIRENWRFIKMHLNSGADTSKRIREHTNKEKDEKIYEEWENMPSGPGYKEIRVQKKLGISEGERSSDAICAAYRRIKKFRNPKKS